METNNKLRDALEKISLLSSVAPPHLKPIAVIVEIGKLADAALDEPVRNCDVYTADELKAIFKSELVSELPIANEHERNLITITAMRMIDTLFATATEKEGVNDADK